MKRRGIYDKGRRGGPFITPEVGPNAIWRGRIIETFLGIMTVVESDLDNTQLRALTAYRRGYSVALLGGADRGSRFFSISFFKMHGGDIPPNE